MDISFNWGTDAINSGFGVVGEVFDLIDWALLDTDNFVEESASSTFLQFTGFLNAQELVLSLQGTGLTVGLDGLSGGVITSVTIHNSVGGSLSNAIAVIEGSFSGAEIQAISSAELNGTDLAAIENYFMSLNWTFEGTNLDDVLPEVTGDGVAVNLLGNDVINLGRGDDVFAAGDGNDEVRGGTGDDIIYGDAGNDSLFGLKGNDELFGGDGDDRLLGQGGFDDLYGGIGDDNLKGGGGQDGLDGGEGNDFLKGGTKDDEVYGGDGNDIVSGNRGNDELVGGDGDDIVRGGSGDDFLFGDGGSDLLKGGSGADVFVFDAQAGDDRVVDFDLTEDTIELMDTIPTDLNEEFELLGFSEAGITIGQDIQAFVDAYASVTSDGVLFDFGNESSFLLMGLTTTDGLSDVITIFEWT